MASSNPTPSNSSLPTNLTLLISNLNAFVPTKLDSTNYIVWKSQIHNILKATKLLGFVDGTIICPSSIVIDSNNQEVLNPDYTQWITIDSHLLSCITATLSSSLYTSVIHCQTSHEVWSVLAKRFTSLSRSHIHQLKNKLSRIVKKGSTMEDYLNQFKTISDQLALASAPVDDEDLVLLVLNGLPDEYNAFKTTIRARSDPISMEDLSSLLCSESIHIESSMKQTHTAEIPYAYSVTRGNYKGGNRGGHRVSFRGRGYSPRGSDFF